MKKITRRLSLNAQTLRTLSLNGVRGGLDGTAGPACDVTGTSCPPQASCFDCGPYSGGPGCNTSNQTGTCASYHSCPC